MGLLEEYKYNDSGFKPLVMEQNWQVAILNYSNEQKLGNVNKIDIHFETDEVFVLLNGQAVLIVAELIENEYKFKLKLIQAGEIYNVPKGVWHNIVMEQDSQVLIVENRDTHLGDFEFHYFTQHEQEVFNKELSVFLINKNKLGLAPPMDKGN